MHRFVAALLSVAVMGVVSANAADLPVKAPIYKAPPAVVYNWAGFYVGIEGGYAWGHSNVTDVNGYNAVSPVGDFSYNPTGGVGNLYGGYNFQFDPFIVGVEGEFGYFGLDGSAQYPPYVGVRTAADSIATTHPGWYGAITGRVGVFFQNFLFFAKGGYAITGIKNSYTDTDATGTTLVSGTDTSNRNGWTVGGGLDYMITPNWIARLEYAYYDFGTASHTATSAGGGSFTFDHSLTASVLKGGIAYKF
jgi:outer membrane immunogenic protein